jgi:Tol biopolymer transport system component
VVEGTRANLDVALSGGGSQNVDATFKLQGDDRAIIDWQRSDDDGASWRDIARSSEDEANPLPFGTGIAWMYWSVRHGFIATAGDQGALIRVHACYKAPTAATTGCITSSPTRLNVLQSSALPAIVAAPRSMLIRTGQTASLSVTASGLPAPTLRWQMRPANSSGAWTDVTTGTGATTANYTTAALALTDNGVQFRAVATNALGSIESLGATVSVSDLDVAPSITTQPASLSVATGSDAVFAVDATGTAALSYQWFRNGSAIAGANGSVLRLASVSLLNSGSFTVTVSNDAGDADSSAAILNVYPGTPAAVAPTIVTQPTAVTANAGSTATFAVGVDGSGPFSFAWSKNGVAIPGATSAVLTRDAVSNADAGSYSVLVSNAASPGGVASSAAVLTVSAAGPASAPTIVTPPSSIVVVPGGSAVLAVAATGSGPLTYQWFKDGAPIAGATAAVLFLPNDDANTAGSYVVGVSNSLSTVYSQPAGVILLGAPVIYSSPDSADVLENSTVTFHVDAAGTGRHYLWLLNGSPIGAGDAEIYTTPVLTVANSGAVYSVVVYNAAGVVVSSPAVLTVRPYVAPTILQQPADVTVDAGLPANICLALGGTGPFSVQMNRWSESNSEWTPIVTTTISDNNLTCLSTPNLQLADTGAQFLFYASTAESGNLVSVMTRVVTVTVRAPPIITATTLASRASTGATANNRSWGPSLSTDGRVMAFMTDGTNLVPGFTASSGPNAYVRNLVTGAVTAVNQTPSGGQSIYGVIQMKLAAGGRYVAFTSLAGDLVAGDTNGSQDVFLRDLQTGTTKRLSILPDGSELTGLGNGVSEMQLDISADGRYVSFVSSYTYLPNEPVTNRTLYLRDTQTDQTRIVASSPDYPVAYSALAPGGGFIAYEYSSPEFQPATVRYYNVETGVTSVVFSLDTTNSPDGIGQGLSISGNGQFVALSIRSGGLFGGSTVPQVVVVDVTTTETLMVASSGSLGSGIAIGDGSSTFPQLSDNGRYVLFQSIAPNLTAGVASSSHNMILVRDLQTQTTSVASRRPNGTPVWIGGGVYNNHAISGDGSIVAVVASEYDMTGGIPDFQVYATPRP